MCESRDFLRSGSQEPTASIFPQWTKPNIQTVFDGVDIVFVDASGFISSSPGGLSCDGWSAIGPADFGLIVDTRGRYSALACNFEIAVACCKVTSGKK